MRFVLDTNIILHFVRNSTLWQQVKEDFHLFEQDNKIFISIATYAEIKSLARQLNWGQSKTERLENILQAIPVLYINRHTAKHYVDIDAFSQRKPNEPTHYFTPRNMGKNDLWIAATASIIEATLITTDSDFDHLNDIFLNVAKVIIR